MPTIEERLAALETKLAALTDTTPTTYYEHQYSGEEIDNAVSRALPNGTIDQAVGTFVRPNLLDNWYFGRPVNQRGQTEYSGMGYTVDRWMIDVQSINVVDNGLTLDNALDMFQRCEGNTMNRLLGRTVTLSLLTADNRLFYGTMTLPSDRKSGGEFVTAYTDANGALQCYIDGTDNSNIDQIFRIYTKTTVTIFAAKLELGPTQTLAHREGDKWVLNEVPDYGEQLRRCQRYFYRVNSHAYGWTYNNNTVNCLIPLPVTLRTSPVITLNESGTINTVKGDASMTSYEVKNAKPNGLIIDLHNSANALTTGTPVVWHNFDIDISADL